MEHTKPTRSRKSRLSNIAFELPISGRSFMVTATPFNVPSGEVFYRISYNNGPVHVFGWDESLNRFAETQKPAHIIPPVTCRLYLAYGTHNRTIVLACQCVSPENSFYTASIRRAPTHSGKWDIERGGSPLPR